MNATDNIASSPPPSPPHSPTSNVLRPIFDTKWHQVKKESNNPQALQIDSFANKIFQAMYALGRKLTHISSTAFNKIQKAALAGKPISTGLYLIIFLAGMALACVGVVFRMAGLARSSVTMLPANRISADKIPHQVNKELSVMTWNTALGPSIMATANNITQADDRMSNILHMIDKENPDVLCLQEVFDNKATDVLSRELRKNGYHCISSVLPQEVGLSSGLFFAVKSQPNDETQLSLDEIAVWKYTNLAIEDRLSNKGLLGVRVNITTAQGIQSVNVFNTHLQASSSTKGFSKVRLEQVKGIVDRVTEWTQGEAKPFNIICGDLNFGALPLEKNDDPAEYAEAMKILKPLVINPFEEVQDGHHGSFIDQNGQEGAVVVDYILVTPDKVETASSGKIKTKIVAVDRTYSDHKPVISSISLASLFENAPKFCG